MTTIHASWEGNQKSRVFGCCPKVLSNPKDLRFYFTHLIFRGKDRLDLEPEFCLCPGNWLLGKGVMLYLHLKARKSLKALLCQIDL